MCPCPSWVMCSRSFTKHSRPQREGFLPPYTCHLVASGAVFAAPLNSSLKINFGPLALLVDPAVGWVTGLPVVELFGVLVGVFGLDSVAGVLAFSPVTDCTSRDPELVVALDPIWLKFLGLTTAAPIAINSTSSPEPITIRCFLFHFLYRALFSDMVTTFDLFGWWPSDAWDNIFCRSRFSTRRIAIYRIPPWSGLSLVFFIPEVYLNSAARKSRSFNSGYPNPINTSEITANSGRLMKDKKGFCNYGNKKENNN